MKDHMRLQSTNWQTVGGWVARVLRMDFSVFEEIRSEPAATLAAVVVVLVAGVFAGSGSWLWALQHSEFRGIDGGEVFLKSLVLGSLVQTAVWLLWVYLVYQVLARGYGAQMDFAELVRTMGFAFVPVAFSILIAITNLAVPFGLLSFGITLLYTNIAIQQVAGTEVRETTLANLTGFGAFLIVMGVFANIAEVGTFGGIAPGVLFFSLDL
ncbi:MAG: hypothetical protein Q7T33_02375 [Dehalococcoidia bacterium]|nr:hypothetical protein [Dehalococcoidia bacterium]